MLVWNVLLHGRESQTFLTSGKKLLDAVEMWQLRQIYENCMDRNKNKPRILEEIKEQISFIAMIEKGKTKHNKT